MNQQWLILALIVSLFYEHVKSWYSPDHARGGVAHGGIFGLDEFLVIVDAAVDFIVLFACQLLLGRKRVDSVSRKLQYYLAKKKTQTKFNQTMPIMHIYPNVLRSTSDLYIKIEAFFKNVRCAPHLLPLGFSDSSQIWPEHPCPSLCPADMWQLHPCPQVPLVSFLNKISRIVESERDF